ncbi:hypothetical protein N9L55_03335 [Alphaproteobacteria bacterium]|nr:hypothetical protein [Alphaproteobacteria bacterium]
MEGEPPDPSRLPSGCSFRTRCPFQTQQCALEQPTLVNRAGDRWDACIQSRKTFS